MCLCRAVYLETLKTKDIVIEHNQKPDFFQETSYHRCSIIVYFSENTTFINTADYFYIPLFSEVSIIRIRLPQQVSQRTRTGTEKLES